MNLDSSRQYRPFSAKIEKIPLIIYPVKDSNPLKEVYTPPNSTGILNHLAKLYAFNKELPTGTYHIVFSWALNKHPMTDIWIHSLDNWADADSGPLVSCFTFEGLQRTVEAGIASGDTLVTLGREEELRRGSTSFTEYLNRSKKLPNFPLGFIADEGFAE